MRNSPPVNPVYCRRCHLEVAPKTRFCPTCGYDQQTPPASVPPKASRAVPPPPSQPAPLAVYGYKMPEMLRKELIRQWGVLNWYIVSGVIFTVGIIGIALFVYAIIQQQSLRRQVAEAGDDPNEFAHEANRAFAPILITLLSVIGCIILVVFLISFFLKPKAEEPSQSSQPRSYYQDQRTYGEKTGFGF